MAETGKCEPFSLMSAEEALSEIVNLLPRTKKADALGAANEIFVVLSQAIVAKAIWAIEYGIAKENPGLVDAGNKVMAMLSWKGNRLEDIIRSEYYIMVVRAFYR